MNKKVYSMLGLCMKAGYLQCGMDACIESIKNCNSYLVIVAENASLNTKEKIKNIATEYKTEIVFFGEKDILSKSIGKSEKVIFSITDSGFANRILQLIKESKEAI